MRETCMWDPYAEFKTAVLSNGLTVHAAQWKDRPWQAMGFLVHTGLEQDPIGLEGDSHFVEHLVSKNAQIPFKAMEDFFHSNGGRANFGATSSRDTQYSFFLPAKEAVIARALELFGYMLLASRLEEFVERERKVITEEFHRHYKNGIDYDLQMREHRALYSEYCFSRANTPLGTLESIGKISQADAKHHYDRYYTPANMQVVSVGAMSLDQVLHLLGDRVFSLPKPGIRTPPRQPVATVKAPLETRYVFEMSKHIDSTTVKSAGYSSVALVPGCNNAMMHLLHLVLEELLDERLRQQLGWTYYVGTSWCNAGYFHQFNIDCGSFSLSALDAFEAEVEACLVATASQEDLFAKFKQQAIAKNFMRDPTGRGVRDAVMDDLVIHNRIVSLAEYEKDLRAVTMDDIRRILSWLRPEQRYTFIRKP